MSQETSSTNAARIPRRPYGTSGDELSIVGFGGIVVTAAEQDHANRVVSEAVERGVNYFDVAPGYLDAEIKLGPALEPYRKNVFLACKTGQREAGAARAELERSLERLRTDYFDLYQLHGIIDVEKDVDKVFAKGGAMEVFIQAKKEGKVRHLGFSAHTEAAALAAFDRFDFDSVLLPINFATMFEGKFGQTVIDRAIEKGASRLALKAMARQHWPENDPQRETYRKCWYQPLTDPKQAELALRYTLSQPITAALPPGEEALFRMALDFATRFRPITPDEEEELKKLASGMNVIFRAA